MRRFMVWRNRKQLDAKGNQKEISIKRDIVQYLNLQPEIAHCWYNANTGIYDPTQKRFRTAQVHYVPDVLGYTNKGRAIGIEVKKPENRAKIENITNGSKIDYADQKDVRRILGQWDFIMRMSKCGCLAFFCYSLDECIGYIEKGRKHKEL